AASRPQRNREEPLERRDDFPLRDLHLTGVPPAGRLRRPASRRREVTMVALARVRRASLAAALALTAASFASPQELPPGAIEGPNELPVVRARSVALDKLRASSCQMIFSEFEDLNGRRLDDVLAAWKITAEDRLRELVFRDGSRTSTCKESGAFAHTSPFSPTV